MHLACRYISALEIRQPKIELDIASSDLARNCCTSSHNPATALTMTDEDIPIPNVEFQLEQLDNELLLYHPAKTSTFYLNETASIVWQLCDGKRCIREIVDLLRDSFPDAQTDIADDVRSTLEAFVEHGAIAVDT